MHMNITDNVGDQCNDILNDNKEYCCMDMEAHPRLFDVSGKGEKYNS